MLVVLGSPLLRLGSTPSDEGEAGGLSAAIARAAAASGAEVQLVGTIGDDPGGDAVLLALARDGVGHIALRRDAGRATPVTGPAEPADELVDADPLAGLLVGADPTDGQGDAGWTGAATGRGLPLDPADIALGLRYVREFGVLVAADPLDEPSSAVVGEAAAFAGATLVVVAPPGQRTWTALGTAIVLEAPSADPDGSFAALVGRFVASLDRGAEAGSAFRDAIEAGGWERTTG